MENFIHHQIGFDEYITGNRFIDICEETDATFCKTDYLGHFRNSNHKVFITHNSDYPVDENLYSLGPQCDLWLTQNKNTDSSNLKAIPIGLENMKLRTHAAANGGEFSSQVNGALEKAILIDRCSSLEMEKTGTAYMNFNIQTRPFERRRVWDMFGAEPWVTKTQNLTLQYFYFDLASHKFVISPRGNGIDCHRTWEALYLRTIPIVKRSIHMNDFKELPIYFIDDWAEVSYNKLNEYYEKVKDCLFDLSMLKISWWRNYINEKLSI